MDILLAIIIIWWAISKKKKATEKNQSRQSHRKAVLQSPFDMFKKEEEITSQERVVVENEVQDEQIPLARQEYKDEDSAYKEERFNSEHHADAYEDKTYNNGLTDLEKGIVFAEVLSKPVSMRKR